MDAPHNHIFFPDTLSDLFSDWNHFPEAVLFAGGTDFIWRQGKNILNLPPVIICLDKLKELHRITRTEHYLEIGSMVKLNKIIWLGKIVPDVLCRCLETVGGVQLRNIATIGGNICCSGRMLDASAPLVALDAQYELRNAYNSRWVAAARFHAIEKYPVMDYHEFITRIRLPLHQWDYSMFKKFNSNNIYNSKTLVFLAKTQKNTLSDIRIIYKDRSILRNKNGESLLAGKTLPLNRKSATDFIENWNEFLNNNNEIDEFSKNEIIDYIRINVHNLLE
ncbi:MAG: FAD binding domain-containing protein [Treponema sp.]|nr:FAD binding domain-containing protein [Treponema sp.]